jgi:drug/metabolite transporter (DMT)-like permease
MGSRDQRIFMDRASDGEGLVTDSGSWQTRAKGVVLVNLATAAWATNAVLGRWLRNDIGPLTLTAVRFTVATALFSLLLRHRPPEERRYGKDKGWLLAMGLTGVLLFSPLLYLGLRYSTAVNSSLIQGFSPLITALIAGWIISEPVTPRQKIGAVLGLIGVAGLISGGSFSFLLQVGVNPGDLIFLAAAVAWAFYSVFGRRVMRNHLRLETIAAILHICIVPTLLGYLCWNRAVQALGAGGAMVFYNTLPLYGVIMGAAFLGEPLTLAHFIFGGLILAGGLWATLFRRT